MEFLMSRIKSSTHHGKQFRHQYIHSGKNTRMIHQCWYNEPWSHISHCQERGNIHQYLKNITTSFEHCFEATILTFSTIWVTGRGSPTLKWFIMSHSVWVHYNIRISAYCIDYSRPVHIAQKPAFSLACKFTLDNNVRCK
jgi:hypothetical protein